MTKQILVADDDPQIVRLVKGYLEQAGYAVITAGDGELALHLLRSARPDLAVLDVMMPKRDGFALAELIRADKQLALTPILMLTARVEDTDKLHGLTLGADDYLTKPFNPLEVVARVKAILRRAAGEIQASPVLRVGNLTLDPEAHRVTVDGTAVEVTAAEFDLLRVFMQHTGRAFTRMDLIDTAFGDAFDGFERTIDSHIKNLRRKIESDPANPRYVQTVYGIGYRMDVQD